MSVSKVVFSFVKPLAEIYNDFHLLDSGLFKLSNPELIDAWTISYDIVFLKRCGEFGFVGWFVDNYFIAEPERIEVFFDVEFKRCSHHLTFADGNNNKSIVFCYE